MRWCSGKQVPPQPPTRLAPAVTLHLGPTGGGPTLIFPLGARTEKGLVLALTLALAKKTLGLTPHTPAAASWRSGLPRSQPTCWLVGAPSLGLPCPLLSSKASRAAPAYSTRLQYHTNGEAASASPSAAPRGLRGRLVGASPPRWRGAGALPGPPSSLPSNGLQLRCCCAHAAAGAKGA